MATTRKITLKKSVSWRGIARKAGHKDRTKTFTLKSQAYAWAIEQEALMEMIDNGDPDFAKSLPLEDCLTKEIETKVTLKEWKPSTQDRGISLKGHLTRLFGPNTPLSAINPPLVDRYQIKRLKEGAANSSIRQELSLLSTMFDRARRTWGVNIANPVKDIKKIAPGPASERILSEEEARIIYEEAINSRNPKFAAYILLLMHTGMRSGEASSLQQNSVYFEKKSIKITKTKTGKTRTVPLSDPVCHALKQIKINDNGYFFMKPNHLRAKNTILKPGAIWDSCWKNLRARVKKKYPQIAYFKAHDLRHTAASHLLMAGTDIRIVADILGHTNLATTMRYTHLLDSHKQETIAKISHLGMPQD